jgi:hypothetical protein
MKKFSVVMLFLAACSQPSPTPNVETHVSDAGTLQPVIHRLKVGKFVTSDGLVTQAPFENMYFDTAFNQPCWPGTDEAGRTRCFPNVGYHPRAYLNGCHDEVIVGPRGIENNLHGTYKLSAFKLTKVGTMNAAGTYWTINSNGDCLPTNTTLDEVLYNLGDDLTTTLETLDLQFIDQQ